MGIFHVVMFAFAPSAQAAEKKTVVDGMLELKEKCVRPGTSQPYIKTLTGGKENSPKEHHITGGLTHIFICEFESAEDREYYLFKDPVHQVYAKSLEGVVVSKIQAVDFTPGEF